MRSTNSLHSVLNSGEAIKTCRFVVFNTHNREYDLFMARRRNLHAVNIDRVRYNISKGVIEVVIAL